MKVTGDRSSGSQIKLFFHCANCAKDKPDDMSPREWARMECGWTKEGFQVWCLRCDHNVVHVDFRGAKVRTLP